MENGRLSLVLAFVGASVVGMGRGQASDHIDGLKTAVDVAADLTDVFTFVSPADPSKLVLIMNVHNLASSRSRFADAVDYKFRIRPIHDASSLQPSTDPKEEQSIVCTFSGGTVLIDPKQQATCTFNLGASTETLTFDTRGGPYRAGGSAQQGGIRVFAGVRSDPWFLDLVKTVAFNAGLLPVPHTLATNGLDGNNVLSIVVEIDKQRLAGPLLAVTAQTVRK
jgi:hypothetical protein